MVHSIIDRNIRNQKRVDAFQTAYVIAILVGERAPPSRSGTSADGGAGWSHRRLGECPCQSARKRRRYALTPPKAASKADAGIKSLGNQYCWIVERDSNHASRPFIASAVNRIVATVKARARSKNRVCMLGMTFSPQTLRSRFVDRASGLPMDPNWLQALPPMRFAAVTPPTWPQSQPIRLQRSATFHSFADCNARPVVFTFKDLKLPIPVFPPTQQSDSDPGSGQQLLHSPLDLSRNCRVPGCFFAR